MKKEDLDDFWDLSKLVPKKKSSSVSFVTRSAVSDYSISGEETKKTEENSLNFDNYKSEFSVDEKKYFPSDYPFIKSVTIQRINDKYDFYGSFRNSAELYFDCPGERCDFVPFYSYMPQYSQLTREQKNYYFYWRDEVRRNRFPKADYSYIYLYVYEILNLPDRIPPEEGIKQLISLWREYRKPLYRIDSYFSAWIQDYCLLYNLKCPMDEIEDFIFDVIERAEFKEFYLSDLRSATSSGIDSLLAYLSDYDWRRGKFVSGDHSELYKLHMRGAMGVLLNEALEGYSTDRLQISVLKRNAFPHSLCTHAVKCRFEIEYYLMSRDYEIRHTVTQSVRYVENKLRALIGIKSRLAVKDLEDRYKRIIDGYFDRLISCAISKNNERSVAEYEKLYEAQDAGFSISSADEIEKVSWGTTLRLIPEDEETENADDKLEQNCFSPLLEEEIEKNQDMTKYGLDDSDLDNIRLSFDGGFCDDAAAERINEVFFENFGDVILSFDGTSYTIIEDYREEISEWLKQVM